MEKILLFKQRHETRKSNRLQESSGGHRELNKNIPSTLTSFCFLVAARHSSLGKKTGRKKACRKLIGNVQSKDQVESCRFF